MYQLWCQYVKRFGCESANELTERRKDTQKHRTDSITLTAEAGGKNIHLFGLLTSSYVFGIVSVVEEISHSICK